MQARTGRAELIVAEPGRVQEILDMPQSETCYLTIKEIPERRLLL
jgi:hypothetical protein